MKKDLAFVDFYKKYDISPVRQDISDLEKHFQRRESLYRTLGIVPSFLQGRKIIEFGPGSGHNAIYTAHLNPSQYVLVDGNMRGIVECRENLDKANMDLDEISFIHSLFQDFTSKNTFDLVLAENCIPHQSNPVKLLIHLASFTSNDSIFLTTCISSVSYLSETIRRLMRDVCLDPESEVNEQLKVLTPLIGPHLKTLKGMSRTIEDWLLDNIVQPLFKVKLFSFPYALDTLKENFDIYGTSPRFLMDWRWYKDIAGEEIRFNEFAVDSYYRNTLNFLDYRYTFLPHSRKFGEELEARCSEAWELMCQLESGKLNNCNIIWTLLIEIHLMIEEKAPETANALKEVINWLKIGRKEKKLKYFPFWWGRGTQYVAFIRK